MARYTTTVASPKTPEAAFAYVADLRNFVNWDPGVSSSELIEGDQPGAGATYRVKASGTTLDYVTEVHDPPSEAFVVARTKFFESRDRITVEPSPEGSRVTYDAELRLNGPLGLFDPLLGLVFNRIGDKAAAGLAEALDAPPVARP